MKSKDLEHSLSSCGVEKSSESDFSKTFMYSIHQMHFLIQKRLESVLFQAKLISFSQFLILVGCTCDSKLPISQSRIAEELYLTEATVSRHISTLVALGYLSSIPDITNRRKHVITITPQGKKVFEKAHTLIHQELTSIFSAIKEENRDDIMKNFSLVLSKLLKKE